MTIKQKMVLIVDDDEDIRKLLNKILTTAGFTVLQAASPEEGRLILAENPPHLIISDLHMEPEDGFSFIRSIRMNKQYAQIPLLVLSALNDFSSVKKAIALGVTDYVIKPLQSQMLLRKLRKALLNKDFIKWQTAYGLEPQMMGDFPATAVAIGETGYSLAAHFKLSPNKEIKPEISDFDEMGVKEVTQRTSTIVRSHTGGLFINDVTLVGISENQAHKIRQYLSKKNQE
jgi:response regulator RpfG family c-di-GMP phosphodiesterase